MDNVQPDSIIIEQRTAHLDGWQIRDEPRPRGQWCITVSPWSAGRCIGPAIISFDSTDASLAGMTMVRAFLRGLVAFLNAGGSMRVVDGLCAIMRDAPGIVHSRDLGSLYCVSPLDPPEMFFELADGSFWCAAGDELSEPVHPEIMKQLIAGQRSAPGDSTEENLHAETTYEEDAEEARF